MIDGVIDRIAALLAEGVLPGEIVVLAPFVSDALRLPLSIGWSSAAYPLGRTGPRGL